MPKADIKKHMSFNTLLQLGKVSLSKGDVRTAHTYLRRAALLEPYNEQVWLTLLDVVQTPDDKRVCLRNILAINPHNFDAQRQLDAILKDTEPMADFAPSALGQSGLEQWRLSVVDITSSVDGVRYLVGIGIGLLIMLMLIGLLILIIL